MNFSNEKSYNMKNIFKIYIAIMSGTIAEIASFEFKLQIMISGNVKLGMASAMPNYALPLRAFHFAIQARASATFGGTSLAPDPVAPAVAPARSPPLLAPAATPTTAMAAIPPTVIRVLLFTDPSETTSCLAGAGAAGAGEAAGVTGAGAGGVARAGGAGSDFGISTDFFTASVKELGALFSSVTFVTPPSNLTGAVDIFSLGASAGGAFSSGSTSALPVRDLIAESSSSS